MHVVQCADFGGPYGGSFVPMLVAAAEEAASRGHGTTVVLPEGASGRPWLSNFDRVCDVRFVRAPSSRAVGLTHLLGELESILAARPGPAVIHTHFDTFDIPAALLRVRRRSVAVFWHAHSALPEDPMTRIRNTLRFACLGRLVAGIMCISPELRRDVRARHAPEAKLIDFPNAIDTRTFAPISASERSEARRSLDLADDARVVLHFGWSWHIKGGDLMLAAPLALGILGPRALAHAKLAGWWGRAWRNATR